MSTLELSKSLGLTPKKKDKEAQLFYKRSIFSKDFIPCQLIELVCEEPKIVKIKVGEEYHNIALDYLHEMQVEREEIERSKHKKPSLDRIYKGNSLFMFPSSFCVLDLETTGYSPMYDKIIEIGIIKVENNKIVDTFSSLVFSDYLPEHITVITGITKQMLENAPSIDEVIPKAIEFIGDNFIVGHNISFDINFLYDAKIDIMNSPLKNDFICTMRLFRYLHPDLPHHRLCDMVQFYNVENKRAHRALEDSFATLECFNKMSSEAAILYNSIELPQKTYSHRKTSNSNSKKAAVVDGARFDVDNPFAGKYCVFTGTLYTMKRDVASQLIVDLGGFAENNVTKKTNFLILGDYDYCKSIKDGKSNKHKKAEQLLTNGQDITIITESVFLELVNPFIETGD